VIYLKKGKEMTENCLTYTIVLIALFIFGIGYNWLVAKLEHQGHDRGYMGFIVAFGCAVTLLGLGAIVGWEPVAWAFTCFAASGIPMIAGSIRRHVRARAKARREVLEENARVVRRGKPISPLPRRGRWPGGQRRSPGRPDQTARTHQRGNEHRTYVNTGSKGSAGAGRERSRAERVRNETNHAKYKNTPRHEKETTMNHTKRIVYAARIGALYYILVITLAPISFHVLQFRAANALKALAVCKPEFALGFALGDFFANQASPFGFWDWAIMPVFDLAGALAAYALRKIQVRSIPWLAILAQSLIIAAGVATFPLGLGAGLPWIPTALSVFISTALIITAGSLVLLPAYRAIETNLK
jgi:uncharacterized membrane protein